LYLSPRLKIIADSINSYMIMADIGSDHAHLPIYLLKNNKIKKAIATDVNKGPIDMAKSHIREYNLTDSIETRLGNGLSALKQGEADVIVIAGMGGILITEILDKEIDIARSSRQLILQPMRNSDLLRRWLYENSFHIIDEALVREEDKIYEIIWAADGAIKFDKKDLMIIGDKLINKAHPLLKEYIEVKTKALDNIIASLEQGSSKNGMKRLEEYRKLRTYYLEVIECTKSNAKL